jgi:transposase
MTRKAQMRRHELSDEQFKEIEHMLPGRKGHVGVTAQDNRIFINGVLWIFKTGAPWRDLPERYGHWKNVHRRFSRWATAGDFDGDYDKHYYKDRNLIERFFSRLKQFRGIATRYCKRGKYFLEAVKLASSIILMCYAKKKKFGSTAFGKYYS